MKLSLAPALVSACILVSCAGAKETAAEATYLGQQLKCVDDSKTLEESRACRERVKAEWAKDGGR